MTSGRGGLLSFTNQVIIHSPSPAASLTDFTILACLATIGLLRKRETS
jgi:hypothetical protein